MSGMRTPLVCAVLTGDSPMAKSLAELGFGNSGKNYGTPSDLDAVTLTMRANNVPSLFNDDLSLKTHVAMSPGWTAWANHCLACAEHIAELKTAAAAKAKA